MEVGLASWVSMLGALSGCFQHCKIHHQQQSSELHQLALKVGRSPGRLSTYAHGKNTNIHLYSRTATMILALLRSLSIHRNLSDENGLLITSVLLADELDSEQRVIGKLHRSDRPLILLPLARRQPIVHNGEEVLRVAVDVGRDPAPLRVASELVLEANLQIDARRWVAASGDVLVQVHLGVLHLRGNQGEGLVYAWRALFDDA